MSIVTKALASIFVLWGILGVAVFVIAIVPLVDPPKGMTARNFVGMSLALSSVTMLHLVAGILIFMRRALGRSVGLLLSLVPLPLAMIAAITYEIRGESVLLQVSAPTVYWVLCFVWLAAHKREFMTQDATAQPTDGPYSQEAAPCTSPEKRSS